MTDRAPVGMPDDRTSHVDAVVRPSPGGDPNPDARLRGLVVAHFDFIWRSLRRLGVAEADTDDAVQEVFLVVSRRLDDIAASKEQSFLFGTALRVASSYRRSAARRRESPEGALDDRIDSRPGPDKLTEQHRARALLDEVLDELDLELRTVFMLFELEELTAPEIAELVSIPVGTVSSRLRRAREAFRAAVRRREARGLREGSP